MDVEMNYVNLVITGNPGVGKHTIADLFVKQNSSYQIFDINKFAIEEGLGEQTDDGIEVDTKKLKNEIQKLNLEKSLIVGHLAPYVLDESNIEYVIILRKNRKVYTLTFELILFVFESSILLVNNKRFYPHEMVKFTFHQY